SCSAGLTCVCGQCTKACADDSACAAFPGDATCMTASCGSPSACDVACSADAECDALGAQFHCTSGRCRPHEGGTGTGGSGQGGGGSGSDAGPAGGSENGGNGGRGAGGVANGGSGNSGGTTPVDAGGGFAHCDNPPLSQCTITDTCKQLTCGGLEFDEQGCPRVACQDDSACPATERCTAVLCTSNASCQYDGTGQ